MKLIAIVARSQNNLIGISNNLPWQVKQDLKLFHKYTQCYPIIMGKNTYTSIGRILPNRPNIVVSHSLLPQNGITVCQSFEKAVEFAKSYGKQKIFVIGGATIYKQSISLVDEIYLSTMDCKLDSTDKTAVYFPYFDKIQFKLVKSKYFPKIEGDDYGFNFEIWKKITKVNLQF